MSKKIQQLENNQKPKINSNKKIIYVFKALNTDLTLYKIGKTINSKTRFSKHNSPLANDLDIIFKKSLESEVTFSFTPKETGTYTFGLTSDDGGDLWLVNYGSVIEWYGGKGTGQYRYGSVSLTAGTTYSFIARMQEYSGGDGLYVNWKRPSQSGYSYQSDEIGGTTTTTSAWALNITSNTNSSGYYSFSRTTTTGDEWYIQVDAPTRIQAYTTTDIQAVSNIILGKTTTTGLSYHMFDVNDDTRITVADKYYIAARKAGRFTKWRTAPDVRLFTTTEYNTIKAATSNVRITYPGVSSVTTSTLTSGGTLNYYLIAPGYAGSVSY
jgi:hypothetical protein